MILDLGGSGGSLVSFVAKNIIVQVFFVVNLADNLCEALLCQHSIGFASLERANAHALAQKELLTEGGWDSQSGSQPLRGDFTYQTSVAAESSPHHTRK